MIDLFGGELPEPAKPVKKSPPPANRPKKNSAAPKAQANRFNLPKPAPSAYENIEVEEDQNLADSGDDPQVGASENLATPGKISATEPLDTPAGSIQKARDVFRLFGLID
ncbi:hypothetical protein GMA3_77 [Gordonia phage GMA3]|uniref:Uncharacterized protein n=1 Tax=Gordonia phage GMA3 TaxID=1647284 RepID=A0A0K0NKY9_9CAUD|nr:hypothetical protein AU105_gp077 [Gordonia phage GMA3]AKL88254.1 hypothetical protein GMA3_77 [Gordonia phage GMA3]